MTAIRKVEVVDRQDLPNYRKGPKPKTKRPRRSRISLGNHWYLWIFILFLFGIIAVSAIGGFFA